ncbi:MAG: OmpA family protein [Legionellales bacterium]|nr:OmpA family protein [Legionellales bacterium]
MLISRRATASLLACCIAGCTNIDTQPAEPSSSRALQGVFAGGAVGAAVGAVSTGVSIPVAAAMGGIVGGAIVASMTETRTPEQRLAEKLRRDKVLIIRVGEDYLLVLPGDAYFYANSSHFNENMYPAIADIAQYINTCDVETVKVSGYTNNQGNEYRNLAMSKTQAQIVSDALWMEGLRPAYMYSIGYGSQYPIATNSTADGQLANDRVQITFRRLTPQS